ncbi:hypothetical protein [Streptomyces sp. LN245]
MPYDYAALGPAITGQILDCLLNWEDVTARYTVTAALNRWAR